MDNQLISNHITPNILIVDDVPANLKVLGEILKGEGYKVRPVPSGALALQVAEKEMPDLILLDIMMPDMDGYEVCRRLKEKPLLREIPIIFISALNDTNDIVKALKSGGVDYITKPFQAEEVTARVNAHVKLQMQSIELKKLNVTKDKFFSIIAHDLKGSMGGFMGVTEILTDQLNGMTKDDIQEFLLGLKDSATNLYRLLENLLHWARMQQGSIPFQPVEIQLLSVISESIEIIQEAAKNKGIEIVSHIPDQCVVLADTNLLQTVIRNLVSNAVKFTQQGGTVNISAINIDHKNVEISISDTGIGMTPAMVDNLFKLDARNGRMGTNGEPSTGLGLILCKEFIEKHNGKINVESEVGKGSVFRFTIPNRL